MSPTLLQTQYPEIGQPKSIEWVPVDTTEAYYVVEFQNDLTREQTKQVATFMGQQPLIAGVTLIEGSSRKLAIHPKVLDREWRVLEWLQESLQPQRPYVGIAQVLVRASPVAVIISVIGTKPSDDEWSFRTATAYGEGGEVAFVSYKDEDKVFTVTFRRAGYTDAELKAMLDKLQTKHLNVTFVRNTRDHNLLGA